MLDKCERCRLVRPLTFYGRTASVEEEKSQNGEWLCEDCKTPRMAELDQAIARMQKALEGED